MSTSPILRRTFLSTVAAGLVLSLGACGFVSDKVDEVSDRVDQAAREQTAAHEFAGLDRAQATPVEQDLATLEQAIGGPVNLLQLQIGEVSYIAQVQDPKNPQRVDAYRLGADGVWGSPEPVQVTGDGTLEEALFAASDIRWAAITDLRLTAVELVTDGGARVNTISVTRTPLGTVQIYVGAEGARGSSSVQADGQGTVLRAGKH